MPISAESEVLTLDGGWKFIKNITCDDKIACAGDKYDKYGIPIFNYKKAYKIERVEYSGTVCHLQNEHLNLLVTADQPLWVCEEGDFEFHDAIDVIGKAVHFMKFGKLDDEFPFTNMQTDLQTCKCKQIISESMSMEDFPSSRYSQIAFHAGYSIDTFIETNSKATRNRRTTQLDKENATAFFDIFDTSSFYSFELSHDIPMYNMCIQDAVMIYVQRHGRACWIGL